MLENVLSLFCLLFSHLWIPSLPNLFYPNLRTVYQQIPLKTFNEEILQHFHQHTWKRSIVAKQLYFFFVVWKLHNCFRLSMVDINLLVAEINHFHDSYFIIIVNYVAKWFSSNWNYIFPFQLNDDIFFPVKSIEVFRGNRNMYSGSKCHHYSFDGFNWSPFNRNDSNFAI